MGSSEESTNYKLTCYQNMIKLQWWLATQHIPIEYSNKLNRKEVFLIKNIIEEDMKNNEA